MPLTSFGQNAKIFDRILGQVSASCQRQSDRNYPKVTFNKGFTSLSSKNIKAGEYAGLMLAYVIAWQTHAGKACYSARAGKEKHDEITEYIHQFEQLLACEAWMKDGKKELTTITGYRDTFVALKHIQMPQTCSYHCWFLTCSYHCWFEHWI